METGSKMRQTKPTSGDNGRPGSPVDGTGKSLTQLSLVTDPNLPPTVVSLMAISSVTAFDRRRALAIVSSVACSWPPWNTLVWLRHPETVPLSLGTETVPTLRFPAALQRPDHAARAVALQELKTVVWVLSKAPSPGLG